MTASEIENIAHQAARQAVAETLLTLGIDVSSPGAIQEVQKDMAHVRLWRQSVDTVRKQSLIAAVGIIVSGIAGAVWLAFTLKTGH